MARSVPSAKDVSLVALLKREAQQAGWEISRLTWPSYFIATRGDHQIGVKITDGVVDTSLTTVHRGVDAALAIQMLNEGNTPDE